jgi:O-antigen ligase
LTVLFIVLSAVFFIIALKWLDLAVMSLPFFFPLYLYKIVLFGVPLTLVETFIYTAFFALLVRLIFEHMHMHGLGRIFSIIRTHLVKHKLFNAEALKFIVPVALIVIGAALSFIATPPFVEMLDGSHFESRRVALGILKGWILNPILFFFLLFFVIKKEKNVLTLFNFYVVSAFVLSLWAVFQIATSLYITPDGRASGPFESANYLALYIAPAVLYILIRIKEMVFPAAFLEKYSFWKLPFRKGKFPVEKPETILLLAAFIIFFVVLLFTKSYAAIIAVIAGGVFYFGLEYLRYYRKKSGKGFPWKLLIAFAAFISVVAVAVYNIDPYKWESMFRFNERNSSSVRMEVYTISLNLLEENPVFGIGMGNFPAMYQTEAERILGHMPYELNMLHPHNLFVAAWLNLGIFGLAGLLWIIILCFKEVWPRLKDFAYKKVADRQKLKVIGLSMMIIILVHGLFDTPFFKNDLALLFWVIVAVCLLPVSSRDVQ